MALSKEERTRVDVLQTELGALQQNLAKSAGAPPEGALFQAHTDGSVYDKKGRQLRGPHVKLGEKAPVK